jgi:hypothetical protein
MATTKQNINNDFGISKSKQISTLFTILTVVIHCHVTGNHTFVLYNSCMNSVLKWENAEQTHACVDTTLRTLCVSVHDVNANYNEYISHMFVVFEIVIMIKADLLSVNGMC